MKKILLIIFPLILFSCSKKENIEEKEENALHKKARAFREAKVSDSAFYYYTLAKDEYLKNNDSLRIGQCLVNMAIIETGKGDFYGSIETSVEANSYFQKTKDSIVRRDLASSFNNMGIASAYMYNYDDAIKFYKEAIQSAISNETKLTYYNNLAVSLLYKKDSKQALQYLKYAILIKNNKDYSRALNNFAKAKFMENKTYNPLPEYYKALLIRKKTNDIEGLNSSYSTLSDYFKNKDSSLYYAQKMLETAKRVKNPEDKLQALNKLINLDYSNIPKYFKEYQSLNDSLMISRNRAKNQFAYFRYGIEKEKSENLSLKADAIEKDNHILRQYFLVATLLIAIIFTLIWYRRRQLKLKQEKELEIKNTQLKMSKKVHDVVANGIYQVMTKIENQEHFNKDEALDELEFVYEKSRDISYEKEDSKNSEEEFKEKISNLIASFKNSSVETYVAGNESEIWSNLSSSIGEEIYQIIRELLVNMKKHSKADRVVFKFERINNFIKIQYTDNGIGISGDLIYKNGLSSTVSRMEKINGEITFDIKTEKGLKINISFPAS
ncbi:MAG: histidine kinase [Chryseobacterium sp.]|jgi:tetratricopeptide (TPR) repeat protein|nr:histidine kinase [Chryseobacterium sp.]